jgi:hypothetical protein
LHITRPRPAAVADPPQQRSAFAGGLALATGLPILLACLIAAHGGARATVAFGILLVVAYTGHIAVSGWLWTLPDVRDLTRIHPWRLCALPFGLVIAGCVVFSVATGWIFEVALLTFFAWQFSHFQRQNLGLVVAVMARWNAPPLRPWERKLVVLAGWCGIAQLLTHPALFGVPGHILPSSFPGATAIGQVALAGWAGCIAAIALSIKRSAPVTACYVSAVLFVAPLFLFHTPLAAISGLVVAHGLQYLWIVGWRSHASGQNRRYKLSGLQTAAALVTIAVLGGAVLSALSESHPNGGFAPHLLYGSYFGIVMAHFVVDGSVWRQRQPTPDPGRTTLVPSIRTGGSANGT